MPSLPRATQTYNPKLSPAMRVVRTARCPQCDKDCSNFEGAGIGTSGHEVWFFHCNKANVKGVKGKVDHVFSALPDRSVPRTAEEMQGWIAAQLLARASASSVSESRTRGR